MFSNKKVQSVLAWKAKGLVVVGWEEKGEEIERIGGVRKGLRPRGSPRK